MKKTIIFITALLFAVFLFAEDTDLVSKRFYPSQVKSISTNFSAGKVTLKADNTEQISVIITGDKEASTPTVKVLTVKTGLLSSVKKKHNVTISVPYGISFDEIKILNFSANAEVQNINAASLTITTSSGKINISDSLKTMAMLRGRMVCSYDEFSVDSQMNRIIKATVKVLLKSDISLR